MPIDVRDQLVPSCQSCCRISNHMANVRRCNNSLRSISKSKIGVHCSSPASRTGQQRKLRGLNPKVAPSTHSFFEILENRPSWHRPSFPITQPFDGTSLVLRNSVRRESRRFPAGANPARPIGRSAGSNQSDERPDSLCQQVVNARHGHQTAEFDPLVASQKLKPLTALSGCAENSFACKA